MPEVLSHQIAAGEIVERPASVIKELMENSLDAHSTRVWVEAEEGGRRHLAVRDDGVGMSREDARLAFRRHATSKISSQDDLQSITTLGFRGEAMPSIASVSRLRLRTVEREAASESPLGTEVEYEGGELKGVREVAWPSGTEVQVQDLFFNIPARRKFLRTVPTELSHVTRQVQCYALAYPEVEFRFSHNGRALFEAPAVGSLRERVFQLMGESFLENLVPVEYEKKGVKVVGFTSLPHQQRSNTSGQYLFVNRRMVRDKVLTHAIRLAYRDLIPSTAHPTLVLLVELDPNLVDVNVHPAKTEIRFRQSDAAHSAVYHGIEEALLGHQEGLASLARDIPSQHLQQQGRASQDVLQGVSRSLDSFFRRHPDNASLFSQPAPVPGRFPAGGGFSGATAPAASSPPVDSLAAEPDPHAGNIPETAHLSDAPALLGQFVESFIVSSDREGVMLIDQHVAHERILYDRALGQMENAQPIPVQRLLIPITIELNVQQKAALEGLIEELNANGLEVEWFGDRTIVVKGVPQMAKDCQVEQLVQSVLEDLSSGRREPDTSGSHARRLREKIAISLSCRAAIKINTPLSPEKMHWLVDELFRCRNPYTCPHGRPIVLRLNIQDILRGFHRI